MLFQQVLYESDCKCLADNWRSGTFGQRDYFTGVLKDSVLLASLSSFHSLCFVNRLENWATDKLAHLAFYVKEAYWIEDMHPQLLPIVSDDVLPAASSTE